MKAGVICVVAVVGALAAAQEIPRMEYEGQYNSARVETELDWSAVLRTWRIKGVLVCTHAGETTTCLWVENAYPCGLFEVVRQPYRTHLLEGEGTLETLRRAGPDLESRHGEAMAFAEARAWTYVPDLPLDLDIPIAIPDQAMLELAYVSELDQMAWRSEWIDLVMRPQTVFRSCEKAPSPRHCAGRWGAYDPRIGFVTQSNEVLASYLQGLRGGRVANDSAGRLTLSRYPHQPRTGHYVQMLSPARRRALSIGSGDISGLERDALSKRGAYLFAHFGIFEVCRGCLPVRLTEERAPQ